MPELKKSVPKSNASTYQTELPPNYAFKLKNRSIGIGGLLTSIPYSNIFGPMLK